MTALKTAIKKFEAAAKAGNKEEAQQLFNEAAQKLDQSVNRGILHKNNAARKKAQLALKLAKLALKSFKGVTILQLLFLYID